jgi:glutathione S-transferase
MTNQKFEEVALTHEQAVSKETKAKYTKLPALVLAGDNMIYETTNIARFLARNTPLYKSENETNMALTILGWVFQKETEKLCAE